MKVAKLFDRFPEIPHELREEPVLAAFAAECGPVLERAQKPNPCSTGHEAANHFYLRLIGPLSIYGYGLSTKEKVLSQLQDLIDQHQADPVGFAASLLPEEVADREIKGPGCA